MPATKNTTGILREMHVIYKRKKVADPAANAKITGPEMARLFKDMQDETKENW
jgi:hypothetical protein